jgi:MFS family permease
METEIETETKIETATETELERNLHGYAPVIHKKWFKNRSLLRALSILGFSTFGFMTIITNMANFAYAKFSLNATSMGLLFMLAAVVQIISRYTIYMPLLNKWGEYLLALFGFVLYLIVLLAFFILSELYQLIIIMVFFSLATSATRGSLSSFISNLANPWERGTVQGIASSLDTFAQIIGPLIGGALLTYLPLQWFTSVSWVFMLIALILLVTATQMRHDLSQKNENFHKFQRKQKTNKDPQP